MNKPRSIGSAIAIVIILVAGAFLAGRMLSAPSRPAPAAEVRAEGKQLWTCGMHPQVIQDKPGLCPICHMELTPLGSDGHDSALVTIDPVVVQNMGVRTAPVVFGSIQQHVRAVGYLEEPEPLHRDVNLRVDGWIEELHANIDGMPIEKGQPLFELYSPQIQVAVSELIASRKSREAAGDEQSRRTSQTLFETTARKLELWGLESMQVEALSQLEQAPETVTFVAPIGGHLTEKKVYEGAGVTAGTMVMRLAERHQMWVEAQVYEQQLPLVNIGSKARATVMSEPGRTYEGEVVFIHPHLDPMTRTALVRIQISNEDYHLRQGMYATVDILTEPTPPGLVVPREAIIDTGTRQVAFVALGGGQFEPRELKLGLTGREGTVQVLDGLAPNEQVVTSGQFLIDSESRLKEAIQKHLSGGLVAHRHQPAPTQAAAPARAPATGPATAPALDVPHADDIVTAYLQIAQALGAVQQSDDAVGVHRVVETARMSAEHASPEAKPLAEAVANAAEAMKGKPLAEQRKAFIALSNAVIALADRSPPSSRVAEKLYVMHCPMAFSDDGADWLQSTPKVQNPYYATQMKDCGAVARTVEPRN